MNRRTMTAYKTRRLIPVALALAAALTVGTVPAASAAQAARPATYACTGFHRADPADTYVGVQYCVQWRQRRDGSLWGRYTTNFKVVRGKVSRGVHVNALGFTVQPSSTGYVDYIKDYNGQRFVVPSPRTHRQLRLVGGWKPLVHRDGSRRNRGHVQAWGWTWRLTSRHEQYGQTRELKYAKR